MDPFIKLCQQRRSHMQRLLEITDRMNIFHQIKLQAKIDEITELMQSYMEQKLENREEGEASKVHFLGSHSRP